MSRKFSYRAGHRSRSHIHRAVRACFLEALEPRCLLSGVLHPLYTITHHDGATPAPGYSPTQVRHAYGLDITQFPNSTVAADGTGTTVAIIDAYSDPNVVADLTAYSKYFNLPAPNITVVNQNGSTDPTQLPKADAGWAGEISLDVDAVHAIAPGAAILLVECNSATSDDLYAGVNYAKAQASVNVITMSFGGDESAIDTNLDTTFQGSSTVTFVASTGDTGSYVSGTVTQAVQTPAASPHVVAAGGTTLNLDATTGNYASETGWGNGTTSGTAGGGGGGISQIFAQPAFQTGVVTQSSTQRCTPDIASAADPNTGFAVYDTVNNTTAGQPWGTVGGTSWASPTIAATIAIADQGRILAGSKSLSSDQTLALIYAAPGAVYHDITSGNNGYAAGPGYDLVTGRGTPIDNVFIPYLITGVTETPAGPSVSNITANGTTGSFTIRQNTELILIAHGVQDTASKKYTVTIYKESNGTPGLQANSDTVVYSDPNQNFAGTVFVDSDAIGTYTYYVQVIDDKGNSTASGTDAPSVTVTVRPQQDSNPVIDHLNSTAGTGVVAGTAITFTADGIHDSGYSRNVKTVDFYLESNGTTGLQVPYSGYTGDTKLATVNVPQSSDPIPVAASSVSYTLDTTTLAPGTYTVYALGTDDVSNTSGTGNNAIYTTFTILDPNSSTNNALAKPLLSNAVASSYLASANGEFTVTVNLASFSGDSKLRYVTFYLEDNNTAGLQINTKNGSGDTLIGRAVPVGNATSVTESFFVNHAAPNNAYTIYAVPTTAYSLTTPGTLNVVPILITVAASSKQVFHSNAVPPVDGSASSAVTGTASGNEANAAIAAPALLNKSLDAAVVLTPPTPDTQIANLGIAVSSQIEPASTGGVNEDVLNSVDASALGNTDTSTESSAVLRSTQEDSGIALTDSTLTAPLAATAE